MPSASDAWRVANSRAFTSSACGAELRAEAQLGVLVVDLKTNEQVQIARRNAVLRRRADDLLQLLDRVEAEGLHAMLEIGLGDGLLGLHRMHEAEHGLRKRLVNEPYLTDRCDVVVRHALVPQDPEQVGRRIRLHRIERPSRELLHEEPGRAARGMRTKKRYRLDRSAHLRCRQPGCRKGWQLAPARYDACATQGTSKCLTAYVDEKLPCGWKSHGAADARYM